MLYPFCICRMPIASVLGKDMVEKGPKLIPFCDGSEYEYLWKSKTQIQFQESLEQLLDSSGAKWGVSGYLENRSDVLKKYPQMRREQRYYHLGIDIIAPRGVPIHAPLNCKVVISGCESGEGNYGGMVVLKCCEGGSVFYILFGHLAEDSLPSVGVRLSAGEVFAIIGDFKENGNWFFHIHVQILTERAFKEGWISKGYCCLADLPGISAFCPDPTFLLFND